MGKKIKRKPLFLILLFVAGFFSLALLGYSQIANDSITEFSTVDTSQLVTEANDLVLLNTSDDVEKNEKLNILEMNRDTGFKPVTILRGLLGLFVLILISYIFSSNRKAVNWAVVGKGLLFQILLA